MAWARHLYGEHLLRAVKTPAVVSYSGWNEVPRVGRLSGAGICSLEMQVARSLQSRCQQAWFLLEGCRGSLFSSSARFLVVILASHRSDLCFLPLPSLHLYGPSSLLIRTPAIGFGAHLHPA